MSSAFWLCAATTTISSAVSLGYSVAAVGSTDGSGRPDARYAFSRSAALAAVASAALFMKSTDFVRAAATAMTIVQAGDAVIGFRNRERLKTVGPALTAAANLAALINLSRSGSRT